MTDAQITCISKIPGDDSYFGITHLGTATRKWTRQQVIIWINANEHTFYTMKDGKRADIFVCDDKQRPPICRPMRMTSGTTSCLRLIDVSK